MKYLWTKCHGVWKFKIVHFILFLIEKDWITPGNVQWAICGATRDQPVSATCEENILIPVLFISLASA